MAIAVGQTVVLTIDAGRADATTWRTDAPPAGGGVPVNATVGAYQIIREIGAGGMGRVYEALDTNLGRPVAIKVIKAAEVSELAAERFIAESRVLAKFAHPGIAHVYAAGIAQIAGGEGAHAKGVPYFVMEYIPGAVSIVSYVRKHNINVQERVKLCSAVCEAVEHAHRRGVIHGDLKPSNIIISESGDGSVRVIDFGIARPLRPHDHAGAAGPIAGTPEYMSPEQASGQPLDERSDVYALGVVIYHVLCGTPAFTYDTDELTSLIFERVRAGPAPVPPREHNPSLAGDMEAIISKAMAFNPADRYPSASRVRNDLERFLAGEAVEARWNSIAYVTTRRVRSWIGLHPRTSVLTLLMVVMLLATTLGVALVFQYSGLHAWYMRAQMKLVGTPALPPVPQRTMLIATYHDTDLHKVVENLAPNARTRGDDPSTISMRAAWSVLVQRLAATKPAAVGFDVNFERASDQVAGGTAALASACAKFLRSTGTPIVTAGPLHNKEELRSPAIAHVTLPAGAVSGISGHDTLAQAVYVARKDGRIWPGWFTAMLAAAQGSDSNNEDDDTADLAPAQRFGIGYVSHAGPNIILRSSHRATDDLPAEFPFSGVSQVDDGAVTSTVELGLDPGLECGVYYAEVPGEEYFRNVTYDLADVTSMSNEQLATLVKNKFVAIADLTHLRKPISPGMPPAALPTLPFNADVVTLGSGPTVPGVYAHLASLESVLAGATIRYSSPSTMVSLAVGAGITGVLLTLATKKPPVLVLILILTCILLVGACMAWYVHSLRVLNPMPAAVCLVMGAVAARITASMMRENSGGRIDRVVKMPAK